MFGVCREAGWDTLLKAILVVYSIQVYSILLLHITMYIVCYLMH